MLEVLDGFVAELRAAGLPVSPRETIDASTALLSVPLDDRDAVEAALGATLVKSYEYRQLFRVVFDVYFSRRSVVGRLDEGALTFDPTGGEQIASSGTSSNQGERGLAMPGPEQLETLAREALASGRAEDLGIVARFAVALFAGVDGARPVGVSYYLHRTLRSLGLEGILAQLLASAPTTDEAGALEIARLSMRLRREEIESRARRLRALIEEEIRRRLVDEQGAHAVAMSMRRPLLDDVDFMHASSEELALMRRAIGPLARLLTARLARKRRRGHHGSLDFRATVRRSLSTGGVPFELHFHPPHPVRPELFVFADVSGSVSAFARFTVQLVYAIAAQFSGVRTVVFIDGVDEVTHIFKSSISIAEATRRMAAEADVVAADGHSDYGRAFSLFAERYLSAINSRTNVIILGDARNNYHGPNEQVLAEIVRRARRVFWLNPEPKSYWGIGDSIAPLYGRLCTTMFECRNLRQLKAFVDVLA